MGLLLGKLDELTIIDIGASGGIDSKWNDIHSNCKFVLFEPDERAFNTLISENNDQYIIYNTALSDQEGEKFFYLTRKQEVSSLLYPNIEFLNKFYDSERFDVIKKVIIKTTTLDNCLRDSRIEVDFIKIDAQGAALSILQGAESTI